MIFSPKDKNSYITIGPKTLQMYIIIVLQHRKANEPWCSVKKVLLTLWPTQQEGI